MQPTISSWKVSNPDLGPPSKKWKKPRVQSRSLIPSTKTRKVRFKSRYKVIEVELERTRIEFISFKYIIALGMLLREAGVIK